ncbi:RnfABCDGE type electron transport complex subunit B [uncultured Thiohalocapsa sp.]|uniref:RnfABCDGE type electron transport complex subunit B n=1 Tax=uncultured Thiohalocapsa sp. TaxID=768990 RepID=UPI0025FEB235|nr:RnfABCDGE type electron transport complex subunit B [uncultured Thiohalocapsa sp.]
MIAAILSLTALGLGLGALLGIAARYLAVEDSPIVGRVEALLPGSQCGQCGYPGCGPAAAAVAGGDAPVTLCPPGGRALAEELAALLGVSADFSGMAAQTPKVAHIHERLCVGCTKCFKRCPTDAIIGANDQIHAVFEDACTGCGKCVDACPTECIELRAPTQSLSNWVWPVPEVVR